MPIAEPVIEKTELEVFQEKVVRIAKQYAKDHDWCSTVDKALKEMGLDPKANAANTITVEVKHINVTYLDIARSDLAGLTPEQELALVATKLPQGVEVVSAERATQPVTRSYVIINQDHYYAMTSERGTVKHIVARDSNISLCGVWINRTLYVSGGISACLNCAKLYRD